MATYTNLASLSGLQVGDVITYTTTSSIDLAGQNVQIEMYGRTQVVSTSSSSVSAAKKTAYGGKTTFNFDSSAFTSYSFYYYIYPAKNYTSYFGITINGSNGWSNSLSVPGDGGEGYYWSDGYICRGGYGGGLTGGRGTAPTYYSSSDSVTGSYGGTQSAGGNPASSGKGSAGTWRAGGAGATAVTNGPIIYGGAGWYGGGGGYSSSYHNSPTYGGGGGSGFILGQSTQVYPNGFMGDDSTLIAALEAAITDGVLTQGGSSETNPKMVITVLTPAAPVPVSVAVTTKYENVLEGIFSRSSSYTNPYTVLMGLDFNDVSAPTTDIDAITSVVVTYSDDSTVTLSPSEYTASWSAWSGTIRTCTVSCTVDDVALTGTASQYKTSPTIFDTHVYEVIENVTLPTNTVYQINSQISTSGFTGLTVKVGFRTKSSGYSAMCILPASVFGLVSQPDMSTIGQKSLTLRCFEQNNNSSLDTSFGITVVAFGIEFYESNDWVPCTVNYFDGNSFQYCEVYTYVPTESMPSPSVSYGSDKPSEISQIISNNEITSYAILPNNYNGFMAIGFVPFKAGKYEFNYKNLSEQGISVQLWNVYDSGDQPLTYTDTNGHVVITVTSPSVDPSDYDQTFVYIEFRITSTAADKEFMLLTDKVGKYIPSGEWKALKL